MAADQLPAEVGEFATYLDGLLARLDASGGWCAVFWQRDPEGMRACLDGREVPPWDVVEALLRDLAGQYGPGGAGPETDRARALHAAALAAYDGRPGGRDALGDRLDVMLREQKYAAERQAALARHLTSATTREQADALRLDLAWARDDHERATARCAELRARMAHLDRRDQGFLPAPSAWGDPAGPSATGDDGGYEPAGPWAGTGAAGRHGAGGLEAGRRTPTGRPAQGEAAGAAARPGASPARAPAGADAAGRYDAVGQEAGRHAPQHPANRTAPGEADGADALPAPDPAVADVAGHYDAVGRGAGRRAPRYLAGRTAPGEATGAVADAVGHYDAVSREPRRNTPQYLPGRTAPGEVQGPGVLPAQAGADTGVPAVGAHGVLGPGPAARPHAPQQPASLTTPGEAAAPGTSGGFTAWGAAPAAPGAFGTPAADSASGAPESPPADPTPATPKTRRRRRGSARFAGMVDEGAAAVVVPPAALVPDLAAPAPTAPGRTPRGARFAGAAEEAVVEPAAPEAGPSGDAEPAEVGRTVDLLARLRRDGRSGEAHALLTEVAAWEPARFPLLAERLHRAGLDADWQTLLWEAASLPAGRLVAAADALVEAGRAEDGRQMLRQGIARPPGEVGDAVLGLTTEGRHREVRVLLDAYVRARTPEEAARSAAPDPRRLVPLLLEAARGVSDERSWDLVHALRVAGFSA
ncbi:hypothetical protein RFN58_35950 [Streptomyces iakyrus]|uniref:hypothetical protein n=1 Tax=Streptomyces iakyrus TaxID=68219 RepID=UPI000527A2D1|nr:hypothetical protein [Streptomyces iakyrus]